MNPIGYTIIEIRVKYTLSGMLKVQIAVFTRMRTAMTGWSETIARSFLSGTMKRRFTDMLDAKARQLELT